MAKVQNTFLKSKMNKDLDARIVPNGEYRDAQNAQISKSESANVGNLENILGNKDVSLGLDTQSFQKLTGVSKLTCIGNLSDEVNSTVYLFFTDKNKERIDYQPGYTPSGEQSNHFVISYNVLLQRATILVKGNFLNFSTENLITGVNILEDLLFWTDNRNQPRVINVSLANPSELSNPIYYTTEDQISVAKYNPYKSIELYQKSTLASTASNTYYETTMKDVSSLFLPDGGTARSTANQTAGLSPVLAIDNLNGQINAGATISLQNTLTKQLIVTGAKVADPLVVTATSVKLDANIEVDDNQVIVFNPNPYFNFEFSGDPDYLEDKFVRFSYRFKYVDNEYSIFAPFTQHAFIPKQDGYFMYELAPNTPKDDQTEAYQSTIVYFVENKVNSIGLRIPLPFFNYTLGDALKIKEVEILYKESDAVAVKRIEVIPIDNITSSSGIAFVNGSQPSPAGVIPAGTNINIDGIQGGIKVGQSIQGNSIPALTTITNFIPSDTANAGTIQLSNDILSPGLDNDSFLTVGDINYFTYNYESTKPTTTLPESELVRVYDKVPLKALAQEVAGNRVMYGNFVNRLTPPLSLDYNVLCNDKADFNVNEVTAVYIGAAATYTAGSNISINLTKTFTPPSGLFAGMVISSNSPGVFIPVGTTIVSTTNNGQDVSTSGTAETASTTTSIQLSFVNGSIPIGASVGSPNAGIPAGTTVVSYDASTLTVVVSAAVNISADQDLTFILTGTTAAIVTLSNDVTFPLGTIPAPVALVFDPGGDVINTTSKIEYPNSSVKQNRNYQVGFVLSDKYGRQSSVILSNNKKAVTLFLETYTGSTLYSPYIDNTMESIPWPGDSLKVLLNNPITGDLYNGDTSSQNYNPLGWYSWKIVVKQTEQEYYNVYLPGIMSSYPNETTLEVGVTSHVVLINDNINKIPRDLNQVGPEQRQFGSSIQLYGRVENTDTDPDGGGGDLNKQYFSTRSSDTATVISTVNDMFDFNPIKPKAPNNFPQFYSLDSSPLIARITTENPIGQLATTRYFTESGNALKAESLYGSPAAGVVNDAKPQNFVCIVAFTGDITNPPAGIIQYDLVSSNSLPDKTYVKNVTTITGDYPAATGVVSGLKIELVDSENNDFFFIPVENELITITRTTGTGAPSSTNFRTEAIPGVQRLAVYETQPTESLLDIYWETSSSGLISDLNSVVLNNQDTPAGVQFFPFLTSSFDEGLPQNSDILTAGFEILDSFGQTITLNPNTFDSIELVEVTNGLGQLVTGNNDASDNRDYFRLVDGNGNINGQTAPWQIQTTSATGTTPVLAPGKNYYDDIFYMFDASAALREFNFKFKVTVDGQENIINKEVLLDNVQPFYNIITVNNNPGSTVIIGPGAPTPTPIPNPPNVITVAAKRSFRGEIARIEIQNGAHNPQLDFKDLNFTDGTLSANILSQKIGEINGPDALGVGTGIPIFRLQEIVDDSADKRFGELKINYSGIFNSGGLQTENVPAALYFVTIRIQDAGQTFEDVIFEIDMRVQLNGGVYDNNAALSGNIFNCALKINFWPASSSLPGGRFGSLSRGENCGISPTGGVWREHSWTLFSTTLLRIDQTRPGVTSNEVGYYLYAAGVFDNENNNWNTVTGGTSIAASRSLLQYSNISNIQQVGTINIPLNTQNNQGHQVQKQTLVANPTDLQPLVKATVVVTSFSVNSVTPGVADSDSIITINFDITQVQGVPTRCQNVFMDWPNANPVFGDVTRAAVNARLNGIKYLDMETGVIKVNYTSTLYNALFSTGILKFWGGSLNNANPWYFSPGVDLNSLARIQYYYEFSEWVMQRGWQGGGTKFGPKGYANPPLIGSSNISLGGMNPGGSGDSVPLPLSNTPDFINDGDLNNISFSIT